MKMKKIIAVLLAVLMVSMAFAGCQQNSGESGAPSSKSQETESVPEAGSSNAAEPSAVSSGDEDAFAEHVSITIASVAGSDSTNCVGDEIYEYTCDRFNCDIEHLPISWSNWDEQVRLWVSSGDMPDMVMYAFGSTGSYYAEYLSWVNQGLLKAFPDNWKEKYPNMARAIAATGMEDALTVDGKIYLQLHPQTLNFYPWDTYLNQNSFIYRKDWAKKLGMDFTDGSITLDEMAEFVKGCKENDFDGNGNVIPVTSSAGNMTSMLMELVSPGWNTFYKKDGSYVWGPAQPETLEGILQFKKYYDNGTLDPDFYLDTGSENYSIFAAGNCVGLLGPGGMNNYTGRASMFSAQNPGMDVHECIGTAAICNNSDGKPVQCLGPNFWGGNFFSPSIDDAVLERCMAILDWMSTEEGQIVGTVGLEGVHWKEENGKRVATRELDEAGNMLPLSTVSPFSKFLGSCAVTFEDTSFIDGAYDEFQTQEVMTAYDVKAANIDNCLQLGTEYCSFISDAKSQYSSDPQSEIIRLVVTPGLDIETEWNRWIESQQVVVQPILDDLQEAFGE